MSTPSAFPGGDQRNIGPDHSQPHESDGVPAPGELGIVEKRSWRTWQLLVAVVVAVLIGMALNYHTVGASQSSGAGSKAYSLPPPSGSTATTTTVAGSGASGTATATSSSTTLASNGAKGAASSSTTTTVESSATTSTVAPSPARVLLGPTQEQGNWTSPSFATTAAGWNIGWAFACTPAPTSGSSFEVFVASVGAASPGAPVISETGASGQAVAVQSTVGQQNLVVQAPANCRWAIKVTGS